MGGIIFEQVIQFTPVPSPSIIKTPFSHRCNDDGASNDGISNYTAHKANIKAPKTPPNEPAAWTAAPVKEGAKLELVAEAPGAVPLGALAVPAGRDEDPVGKGGLGET